MRASNVTITKKGSKEVPDLEEAIEEEDEAETLEPVEVEDENDLKTDKYIKQPKKKSGKKTTKADDDKEEGAAKAPAKGKAKGRPKKA